MVQPILILSLADPDLGPDYVSVVHAATTILTNMVCIASMLFFLFWTAHLLYHVTFASMFFDV